MTTKTRTASPVTLKVRAFARAERLREKITKAVLAENDRRNKHDARVDALQVELRKAEDEYAEHDGSVPVPVDEAPAFQAE